MTDQGDAEREALKEPAGDEDYCVDCQGTGSAGLADDAPCPYCRPADARAWAERHPTLVFDGDHVHAEPADERYAEGNVYDPAEDADSELVGNPAEEDPSADDPPADAVDDIHAALALEVASDDEIDWLLTWTNDARLRDIAEAERNTRAVERAAAEAQRYLDANEGGWAPPNTEQPE
jgi:hypothetical protein